MLIFIWIKIQLVKKIMGDKKKKKRDEGKLYLLIKLQYQDSGITLTLYPTTKL